LPAAPVLGKRIRARGRPARPRPQRSGL